jgi:hypothetical protein
MHRRRPPTPTTLIAVAAVSALAAGCGAGTSTTVAKTATAPTPSGALAYARCMRSNGVANFPDPTTANNKQAVVSALEGAGNSKADAASTACKNVNGGSPGTGQGVSQSQAHRGAMLAFARCMRRRGLVNFPDPSNNGGLTHAMLATAGIDLHQPGAVRAADACAGVTHGVITKAVVARFIAGQ